MDDKFGWYVNMRHMPGKGFAGRTEDGGRTWQEQRLDTDRAMKLQFVDKDRG